MAPGEADEEECGYLWSRGFYCNEFKLGKLLVKNALAVFFKLSTPYILAINRLLLFQISSHNMLHTCVYHQLPPTCFVACYTIVRQTIVLLAKKKTMLFASLV